MVSLARRRLGIVALLWGAYVQVALAQPSDVSYAPQVLQQCASEPDALRVLGAGWDEDLSAAGAVGDIVYLAERNWWRATKELLRLVREQSPQTDLEPARRFITSVRDDAASALMLLRVNTAEDTTLSPAFQWAQDMDNIYLNVKFSSRMDGPTTVLNVIDENATITSTALSFTAVGRDKPKRIRLHLTFADLLDPEASAWSFSAVGRVSFTLRKARRGVWEGGLLAPGSGRPRNMSPWYERQEALDKEIEAERQAEELRERLKAYREKMEAARAAAAAGGDAQSAGAAAEGSAAAGASAGKSAGASVGDAGAASAGAAAGGRAGAPAPQRAPPGASSDDDEDDSLFSTLARPPTPPVPPASSPAPPAKRGNGKKGAKKRGAAAKPAPAEPPIREWSAQRLGEWLRAEGFGEYVRAFERHDMDGGALVETTEEELRTELDMRTLGVRKRLRLAVCRKHPKCTVPANTVGAWSEEQVGEWLAEHELGQHAPRFRKHRVDGAALIEITEEELKDELGVRSVKDRKTFRVQLCEASSDCNILPTEIGSWSESEVADWLQSFGYRQHCRRFAQKGIDGVALLELTEPDLKDEFGVRSLGLRKRFGRSLCAADSKVCSAIESIPDQYTSDDSGSAAVAR